MSSKRRADRQITKDDKDLEGDSDNNSDQEVTYGITKASTEQIKARRIVRVKRPESSIPSHTEELKATQNSNNDTTEATKTEDNGEQQVDKPSNPFASIQLTSSSGDKSSSVFGASTGFRGFQSIASTDKTDTIKTSIFGASSGFQGFGSLSSSSSSTGFGTNTQNKSSSPTSSLTFGGFASLKSTAPSSVFTFGNNKKAESVDNEDSKNSNNTKLGDVDTKGKDDVATAAKNQSADHTSNTVTILPEDYVLESGEEGYQLELELRCKSYRWMKKVHVVETKQESHSAPSVPSTELFTKSDENQSDEKVDSSCNNTQENETTATNKEQHTWVEQGVGPARILQVPNATDQFARLIQRRQAEEGGKPTKLLINLLIGRESTADPHTDKVIRVSSVEFTEEGTKPVLYLFRFKDSELTTKFLDCLRRIIPQTKSFQHKE